MAVAASCATTAVRFVTHPERARVLGGVRELAEIAGVLGKTRVTLDGELVCLRADGRPDFSRLRERRSGGSSWHPAMFQVFELLHFDGRSTRPLPYRERRVLLARLALDGPAWRTPASLAVGQPEEFVSRVAALGIEGVVAKRLDSTYASGRRAAAWIKQKFRREEQLAITGVRRSRDGRLEGLVVTRPRPDGSFTRAGTVELGLRRNGSNPMAACRPSGSSPWRVDLVSPGCLGCRLMSSAPRGTRS